MHGAGRAERFLPLGGAALARPAGRVGRGFCFQRNNFGLPVFSSMFAYFVGVKQISYVSSHITCLCNLRYEISPKFLS